MAKCSLLSLAKVTQMQLFGEWWGLKPNGKGEPEDVNKVICKRWTNKLGLKGNFKKPKLGIQENTISPVVARLSEGSYCLLIWADLLISACPCVNGTIVFWDNSFVYRFFFFLNAMWSVGEFEDGPFLPRSIHNICWKKTASSRAVPYHAVEMWHQ